MSRRAMVLTLLLASAAIGLLPLLLLPGAEFAGADGQGAELITALRPGYIPWLTPLFTPPGAETESLLFALQAALGAGGLGFGFGYLVGRRGRL